MTFVLGMLVMLALIALPFIALRLSNRMKPDDAIWREERRLRKTLVP